MAMKISENFLTPTLSPKTSICIDTDVLVRCRDKAKSKKYIYKTLNSILLLTSAANDMKSILFCPHIRCFSFMLVRRLSYTEIFRTANKRIKSNVYIQWATKWTSNERGELNVFKIRAEYVGREQIDFGFRVLPGIG